MANEERLDSLKDQSQGTVKKVVEEVTHDKSQEEAKKDKQKAKTNPEK